MRCSANRRTTHLPHLSTHVLRIFLSICSVTTSSVRDYEISNHGSTSIRHSTISTRPVHTTAAIIYSRYSALPSILYTQLFIYCGDHRRRSSEPTPWAASLLAPTDRRPPTTHSHSTTPNDIARSLSCDRDFSFRLSTRLSASRLSFVSRGCCCLPQEPRPSPTPRRAGVYIPPFLATRLSTPRGVPNGTPNQPHPT